MKIIFDTAKSHPKKSVVGASVLTFVVGLISMWSTIYPMICPLLNSSHREICTKAGIVAGVVGKTLDENLQIDEDIDGGQNDQ